MANTYDEILKACYENYKEDWKRTHVTPEEEAAERRAYEEAVADAIEHEDADFADIYPNFDAWVEDNGYGGSLWACLGEFEDIEFRDPGYMASILVDNKMWTAWLDVAEPTWPEPKITTQNGWASK